MCYESHFNSLESRPFVSGGVYNTLINNERLKMAEQSMKYTFVCDPDNCDTMIEITVPAQHDFPNGVIKNTCPCGREMSYISVIILPTNERNQMSIIDETPNIIKPYTDKIEALELTIKNLEYAKTNLNQSVNKSYTQVQQLRSYLMDNYEELELHTEEIANIFDIPLTKTVEFEATIIVTGSVEVELFGGIDLDEFLSENLYVDSGHGDVYISDHTVDHVRED